MARSLQKLFVIVPVTIVLAACTAVPTGPPSPRSSSPPPHVTSEPAVLSVYLDRTDSDIGAAISSYRNVIDHDTQPDRKFIARWRLADLLLYEDAGTGNGTGLKRAAEAVKIYQEILAGNQDQALTPALYYQLAKAYEKSGRLDDEVTALGVITRRYPESEYASEAWFRRGEVFFDEQKYRQAMDNYRMALRTKSSMALGHLAHYKIAWSYLLLEQYENSVRAFITLLDQNEASVLDLYKPAEDKPSRMMKAIINDSIRAITLCFSYFDSQQFINRMLATITNPVYADMVYEALARHYQLKRRLMDAAGVYVTFYKNMPDHRKAPYFLLKAQEIYLLASRPDLVLTLKHDYVRQYRLNAQYWASERISEHPQLIKKLQQYLDELASYYHARAQKRGDRDDFRRAEDWYVQYIEDFPNDRETPRIHFLLAELYYETGQYQQAIDAYERVAYEYPLHDKSAEAGYAGLLAYEALLEHLDADKRGAWKKKYAESLLKFSGIFPHHQYTGKVLAKSVNLFYEQQRYDQALEAAYKAVKAYVRISDDMRTRAWLIIGDIQYDRQQYPEAEEAYGQAMGLMKPGDQNAVATRERYALAVYKQGALLREKGDINGAVSTLLRMRNLSSDDKVIFSSEQEAAALLIEAGQWDRAAAVLNNMLSFRVPREQYADINNKLAYVYLQNNRPVEAAKVYLELGKAGQHVNTQIRKEALLKAAELFAQNDLAGQALVSYQYLFYNFNLPADENLRLTNTIAGQYKNQHDTGNYYVWLEKLLDLAGVAKAEISDEQRRWAAQAALELARPLQTRYADYVLDLPLTKSLAAKKKAMEAALQAYNRAVDFNIAEVTTEAMFHIAELYHDFGRALLASQRPADLSDLELEQYEILLEEQAYPFEEQAISLHRVNYEYLFDGFYNAWIQASLDQLAELLPVRYGKKEMTEAAIEVID